MPSVNLPPQDTSGIAVVIMDCSFTDAGLDLTFLNKEFVEKTGASLLAFSNLNMRGVRLGAENLEPFFDGREAVELVGCRHCGCPCYPEDGVCPKWAAYLCVLVA